MIGETCVCDGVEYEVTYDGSHRDQNGDLLCVFNAPPPREPARIVPPLRRPAVEGKHDAEIIDVVGQQWRRLGWIAARLNVERKVVREAVRRLVGTGHLERHDLVDPYHDGVQRFFRRRER